jgi:hypothetical protein
MRDRDSVRTKTALEKTPNRAGATPLFRLSAAQKVRGVAPALRHADRVPWLLRVCDRTASRVCAFNNMRRQRRRTNANSETTR